MTQARFSRRWKRDSSPLQRRSDLCVVHVSGMGSGKGDGIDRFAHVGMVKRVIGGHWGWTRGMQELAADNLIEAYCLPQGTLSHLLARCRGARPRRHQPHRAEHLCGPARRRRTAQLCRRGRHRRTRHALRQGVDFHPGVPARRRDHPRHDADDHGNITMEGEGLLAETLAAAQAVKNNGGIVLAQVRNRVPVGTLDRRSGASPGHPGRRRGRRADPAPVLGDRPGPLPRGARATERPHHLADGIRRAQGHRPPRRGRAEVRRRGQPRFRDAGRRRGDPRRSRQGIRRHLHRRTGPHRRRPAGGTDFGMARNAEASVSSGAQFDWYDGGGVDIAVLSFAEVDAHGNVNVGRFGRRAPGVGGFINISQGSRRVVFVGTFVAGGSYELDGGRLDDACQAAGSRSSLSRWSRSVSPAPTPRRPDSRSST